MKKIKKVLKKIRYKTKLKDLLSIGLIISLGLVWNVNYSLLVISIILYLKK